MKSVGERAGEICDFEMGGNGGQGREGGRTQVEGNSDVRGSVPSSVGTLSLGRIGAQNSNQTEGAKRAP